MTTNYTVSQDMIGKYVNHYGYTDIYPIGRIIGVKGKTTLIIQSIEATEQTTKMEFIPGGFAGHCVNQHQQKWEFKERDSIVTLRYNKTNFSRQYAIEDEPRKYYDYNF